MWSSATRSSGSRAVGSRRGCDEPPTCIRRTVPFTATGTSTSTRPWSVTYLSKLLHQGESLSKTYASVDEMKALYRDREIKLRQKIIRLRPKPRKLFVLGSPVGLIQVYA